MAAQVIFTTKARQALLDIAGHIALDNEAAAFRLVADLEKRVADTLSLFPEAGPKTEGGQRVLTVRQHSVVYRFDAVKGEVLVLDIFGPGMDWR